MFPHSIYIKFLKEFLKSARGHFISLLAIAVTLCGMTACKDEGIASAEDHNAGNIEEADFTLRFAVNLDRDLSSKATPQEGDIDNYIDTEDKFQVLFFDSKGDFLFNASNFEVQKSPDSNGQWYVTIPFRSSNEDKESESAETSGKSLPAPYTVPKIKAQLEKEDFKIAVLANWTNQGSSFKLDWGWNESKLNSSAVASGNVKNINNIHHLAPDSYYNKATKSSSSDPFTRKEVYSFLMDGDNIGLKTDWVTSEQNFEDREAAENWIRSHWNPSETYTDNFKKNYTGLWQVWNLGGCYTDNALPYEKLARAEGDDKITDDKDRTFLENTLDQTWNQRSGNSFKTWLGDDHDKTLPSKDNDENIDGFYFVAFDDSDTKIKRDGVVSTAFHKDNLHGIALGRTNDVEEIKVNNSTTYQLKVSSDYAAGYIKIKAPASGILRILWSSDQDDPTNKNGAKLVIQRNSNYLSNTGTYYSTAIKQYYKEITITQEPEDIYIYNVNNKAKAVIYAIEYICDKLLYDTDRKGKEPSIEQPIPMYGLQNFAKIDSWGSEKILNLSQSGKFVNLIRALAKVELYLPANSEVTKVYMRSMNRMARCEPMDVENPTIDGWTKFTGRPLHDANHCEWFDIQKYGSGFGFANDNNISSPDKSQYQNWLSWFYGSWNKKRNASGSYSDKSSDEWSWLSGVTIPSLKASNGISEYPHIFNPDIERSDFCEFISKGLDTESGMLKYVLYVPDKNIDDPNDVGDITSTPKVAHIEYRFARMSKYYDDNDCVRIYFTDYKNNQDIKNIAKDQFDNLEKNLKTSTGADGTETTEYFDYLKDLWPIMRNHIYRFYVGSDQESLEVRVAVNEWGETDPKIVKW